MADEGKTAHGSGRQVAYAFDSKLHSRSNHGFHFTLPRDLEIGAGTLGLLTAVAKTNASRGYRPIRKAARSAKQLRMVAKTNTSPGAWNQRLPSENIVPQLIGPSIRPSVVQLPRHA